MLSANYLETLTESIIHCLQTQTNAIYTNTYIHLTLYENIW